MDNLVINYDETVNLGMQIINKGEEFGEIVLKIQSTIDELGYAWQGDEAIKFLNTISEEIEEMKLLSISINEIGMLLQKIANSYQSITFNNNM